MNLDNIFLSYHATSSNIATKANLGEVTTDWSIPEPTSMFTIFLVTSLSILLFIIADQIVSLCERFIQQRRMNALHDEVMALCEASTARQKADNIIYLGGPAHADD